MVARVRSCSDCAWREPALLLDDVGEVAMHGEHAAAGQGPVGHLDGAAGDGAPPLGRLARQVEARDAAGDPALQAAGQRLERAIVAAQRAMADDVPEGRQPLQHLVRHVVQAGHRLVLVDPAAVAFVEQRAVAHVVEHGAHGLLGEGDVAMRIVEVLGEVVRRRGRGRSRARVRLRSMWANREMMATKPSMIAASPMACRLPSPSTSTPAIGSTSEAADNV